ncbi:Ribonuclease H2 non-catalytic subunit (Ylr154p-like) [Novymonas esmeraldas]|uniref:Ribonuclease H2 non-catalytic subunit (Ylr154p-like) n=1 Tax=Novymonas esmeraldas TaxID=1808958 RepID=A0AAW0EXA1_9TRYP
MSGPPRPASPCGAAHTHTCSLTFHSLPVQTDLHGTTDVRENFTSVAVRDAQTGLWRSTLRGRTLLGQEVSLPEDYVVAVASVPTQSGACAAGSDLEAAVHATAPAYVVWEHDRAPAAASAVPQWIALAELIHGDGD